MQPKHFSFLREIAVYGLVSLLVWQPVLGYADVAPDALPVLDNISRGNASIVTKPADMAIRQDSARAVYNWHSFNIGEKSRVDFNMVKGSGSIALNKVNGGGGSHIMGKLSSNGTIYLLDRNGVIFGENSHVNVGSLLVSTLQLNEELEQDFLDPNSSIADAIKNSQAAFAGGSYADATIELESGASIQTTEGGQVFLFAPEIITANGSSIKTPGGQTIMAAAHDEVFLAASTDPDLRGMLVEVKTGGNIEHAGEVVAERGNITLAALAVNQNGTLKATTSVDANGTIRLLARDGATAESSGLVGGKITEATPVKDTLLAGVLAADGEVTDTMQKVGRASITLPLAKNTSEREPNQTVGVTFGSNSVTAVTPDRNGKKATDQDKQAPSFIEVMGKTIDVESGAKVIATGGVVSMVATTKPNEPMVSGAPDPAARITLHEGSLVDVSGADTAHVEMERNSLEVELRGAELADSPIQRNDPAIRGKEAYVDLRYGEEIEFADISGYVSKLERTVDERVAAGGKVNLHSEGAIDFKQGAQVDISGGAVHFDSGHIKESRVISNGVSYAISEANPDRDYDALINPGEYYNERWNLVQKYKTPDGREQGGLWVEGYTDGRSAGEFNWVSNTIQYDGNVRADLVVGPYQRENPGALSGGFINIDTTYFTNANQAILLTSENKFREHLAQHGQQDPLASQTLISVDRFANSADNISIKTAADLTLDSKLTLDGGGDLKLQGLNVQVNGSITNRAGDVSLSAQNVRTTLAQPSLTVADNVTIDTSGQWVNDVARTPGESLTPVRIDAGSISLKSGNSLTVGDASLIANGGGWLKTNGDVEGGNGGDISLGMGDFTSVIPQLAIDEHATFTSHSLAKGGQFSLDAAGFDMGADAFSVDSETGRVSLPAEWFQQGGFSGFSLNAKRSGIDIREGTKLALKGERYQLSDTRYLQARSGTDLDSLFSVVSADNLPGFLMPAVDLELSSMQAAIPGSESADGIRMGLGAEIVTQPGARVGMSSKAGDIMIDGKILASGGNIDMQVSPPDGQAFDPSLAIRLGAESKLDVSATSVERIAPEGRTERDLYSAGTVTLDAKSGYLLAAEGSEIAADGHSTNISYFDSQDRIYRDMPVDLAAGTIRLRASEGVVLEGNMHARAAGNGRAGTFDLAFNTVDRKPPGETQATLPTYTLFPMTIRVGEYDNQLADNLLRSTNIRQGFVDHGLENGVAYLDIDRINLGGFANIKLSTINQDGEPSTAISFHTEKTLRALDSLQLQTPEIRVNGLDAHIEAPYVILGAEYSSSGYLRSGGLRQTAGSFTAQAGFIDVLGGTTFSDADKVLLDSQSDIRLRGAPNPDPIFDREAPVGELVVAGDLELVAGQVYTSTLANFTIDLPNAESKVTISNRDSNSGQIREAAPVLSAGGNLVVNADHILQNGVIKSPFGSIHLNANQHLQLGAGSVTSVSGEGQTVLFGTVDGVGDWQYELKETEPLIYDDLAEKTVTLDSPSIDHQDGATVNVSGGGDLLAYYFVAGPQGSTDVLSYGSGGTAGSSFAIMPASTLSWTPYDPLESANSPYAIGDTIRFENSLGLNPNTDYVILPARYALLPGAMLVTPTDTTFSPGANKVNLRGAAIVAGQFTRATGANTGETWSNFVIEPGLSVLDRSELRLFSANRFFDANRPVDAGRVVYDATGSTSRLNIDGDILARAGSGGVGGRMDINAANIVVGTATDPDETATQFTDDQLESLAVDSILLGGVRSSDEKGQRITVGASNVEVKSGVDLQVSELLLTATDAVNVRENATLRADRPGNTRGGEVELTGNSGAFLQVSSGEVYDATRNTENLDTSQGELVIEQGATIYGEGAVLLGSTGGTLLDGDVNTTGTLAVNANRILLGGEGGAAEGTVLSSALLNQLTAKELRLWGRESVDLAADVNLSLANMVLDTRRFGVRSDEPIEANIQIAESFLYRNRAVSAMPGADEAPSGSVLNITANAVYLEGAETATSQLNIAGFDQVNLTGIREVKASGRASLESRGAVTLSSGKLTSVAGSDLTISATGDLQLNSVEGSSADSSDGSESFASRYILNGDHVSVNARILASSGTIEVNAENGIELGNQAELDVSGSVFDFAGEQVATDAGSILLTTRQGDIVGQTGANMDLSSRDIGASSGTLLLSARNGTVRLQSSPRVSRFETATGGTVAVEVAQLDSLSSLLPSLEDFSDVQRVYVKSGDLTLQSTDRMRAKEVELITDNGVIRIDGEVDASGAEGGGIGLYASDDIDIGSTGRLLANATADNGDGGKVIIASAEGVVNLEAGSYFNVAGTGEGEGGTLRVEAKRPDASDTDIQFNDAGTVVEGADKFQLVGMRRYTVADGQAVDQAFVDTEAKAETSTFMAAMEAELSQAGNRFNNLVSQFGERFVIAPGVEFYSDSDLVVSGKTDLAAQMPTMTLTDTTGQPEPDMSDWWRYEQDGKIVAGTMRFRSRGNVEIQQDISDGFIFTDPWGGFGGVAQDTPISYDSWRFEVAAGSSDQQAKALSVDAVGVGSVNVHDGAVLRTGTGDIAVSTGADLKLGDGASIYTGGNSPYVSLISDPTVATPEYGVLDPVLDMYFNHFAGTNRGAVRIFYPENGGDVTMRIGGDLSVDGDSKPHTDWLFRLASKNAGHFTWGMLYENFVNGVGALGGGDIDVAVKGSVSNLTLAVPTTAMQIAAYQQQSDVSGLLDIRGGGDIKLQAGGDVLAGNYVMGRGALQVESGGRIGKPIGADEGGIASLVALGEGTVLMRARNDIEISGIVDQNLIPISINQTPSQSGTSDERSQFLTNTSADSAELISLAGNIKLNPTSGHHEESFYEFGEALDHYDALPAQVSLTALQGGVDFLGSVGIESHPDSALKIHTRGNIRGATSVSVVMGGYQDYLAYRMGDALDGERYASQAFAPIEALLGTNAVRQISERENSVTSSSSIFSEEASPIRIVSQKGSLTPLDNSDGAFVLELPRTAYISVGGNIEDTKFYLQNNFASDLTYVRAGGDIRATTFRTEKGGVGVVGSQDAPTIGIQGPGTLLVEAGGDIDLGASAGIVSWGDRFNTALPDTGADVFVLAGLKQNPDFAGFSERYMSGSISTDQATSFIVAALTAMTLSVDEINAILDTEYSANAGSVMQAQHPDHLEVVLSSSDTRNLTPAQSLFLSLNAGQQLKVATVMYEGASPLQQRVLAYRTLQNEVTRAGYEDASAKEGENLASEGKGFTRGFRAIDALFKPDVDWTGDIGLVSSTVTAQDGGDVSMLAPGGNVDVGLPDAIPGIVKTPAELGIITSRTGDVSIFADGDVLVNQSRIFALDGDVSIWSSRGDIDAGRGSKTASSDANPNVFWNAPDHRFVVDTGTVVSGSGIRAESSDKDGSYVNLSAPQGAIDAGDAGIGATNVVLAGAIIRGADNIDVGGVSIGVPTNSGVSTSVTAAGNSATGSSSGAMNEMSEAAESASQDNRQVAFLTVEIIGLGD